MVGSRVSIIGMVLLLSFPALFDILTGLEYLGLLPMSPHRTALLLTAIGLALLTIPQLIPPPTQIRTIAADGIMVLFVGVIIIAFLLGVVRGFHVANIIGDAAVFGQVPAAYFGVRWLDQRTTGHALWISISAVVCLSVVVIALQLVQGLIFPERSFYRYSVGAILLPIMSVVVLGSGMITQRLWRIVGLLLIVSVPTLLTLTRSIWLGTAVAMTTLYLGLSLSDHDYNLPDAFVLTEIGVVAGAFWTGLGYLIPVVPNPFAKMAARVQFMLSSKVNSLALRLSEMMSVMDVWVNYPLLGQGLGGGYYPSIFRANAVAGASVGELMQVTESVIAELLLRTGGVGFLLAAALFILCFRSLIGDRNITAKEQAMNIGLAASLLGMLVMSIFTNFPFHPGGGAVAGILLGLSARMPLNPAKIHLCETACNVERNQMQQSLPDD